MRSSPLIVLAFLTALFPATAQAQQRLKIENDRSFDLNPFPGFKIAGNLYYVGNYDYACFLIDTGAGLILINTGGMQASPTNPGSYAQIKANIAALGFKASDIKIITTTHAHWDHVADFAAFKKDAPAAKVYVSARDAQAVEIGGNPALLEAKNFSPPEYRDKNGLMYDPVKVDVKTNPGDHIKLGNTDMTVLKAYGHTPGAVSLNFTVKDGAKSYNVYIVNMDVVTGGARPNGTRLLYPPAYPGIVEDIRSTLAEQAKYKPDIWLSSHAFQFNMHKVYKPGDAYNPARFGDLAAYRAKIELTRAAFEAQLAYEKALHAFEEKHHLLDPPPGY